MDNVKKLSEIERINMYQKVQLIKIKMVNFFNNKSDNV